MKKTVLFASCILGGSIILAALMGAPKSTNQVIASESNPIFTDKEVSVYLHITTNDLQKIIDDEKAKRQELQKGNVGSWDTYRFLPYATISGNRIYMKEEVDQWIKYHSLQSD